MNKLHTTIISTITALLLFAGVASAQAVDEIVYFHPDALGSATAAYNEAGEECWNQDYTPYGEKIDPLDGFPPSGCGLLGSERGYTGHVQDTTGLVYMQQRYYDPTLMRFLSIDPVGVNAEESKTFNRYVYAVNNPYRYVDPDGRYATDSLQDGIEGAIASRFFGGVFDGSGESWAALAADINDIVAISERDESLREVYIRGVEYAIKGIAEGDPLSVVTRGKGKVPNSEKPKGLQTPEKYFENKTYSEAEKALTEKYGPPRGGGKNNKSFFNKNTKRTFNLHKDPDHRDGKAHIDVRKRGLPTNHYKDRPFFLKED